MVKTKRKKELNQVNNWDLLWEERGQKYPSMDPVLLDGYDNPGLSLLDEKGLSEYILKVRQGLDLKRTDLLLDVGCGAGMLLGPLSRFVKKAVGCDLAASMINRAKILFPHLKFYVCGANNLPFKDNSFNKVSVTGVFHYFPNLNYAKQSLLELERVCAPRGRIMITSIPDEELKEEANRYRVGNSSKSKPIWKSSFKLGGLDHQFYKKSFFKKFFEKRGYICEITKQDVSYGNAPFRFNVLAIKR